MIHAQRCSRIVSVLAVYLTAVFAVPVITLAAESTDSNNHTNRVVSPQVVTQVADDVDNPPGFESIYNQGVAQYREGAYAEARDLFTRSPAPELLTVLQ